MLQSLTRPHPASIFQPIKNLISLVYLITHSFQNGERNGVFSDSQFELSNISDELSSLESSDTESACEESDSGATDLTGNSSQRGRKRKIFPSQRSTCDNRRGKKRPKKSATSTDKSATKGLSSHEMEELSSWIFPAEEAKQVESEARERLLKSSRLKAFVERRKFALHLTSEEQKDSFGLLITGFCRKFATLAK